MIIYELIVKENVGNSMDTLILKARSSSLTEEIIEVTKIKNIDSNILRDIIANGKAIIIRSLKRYGIVKLLSIGEGLRTKVNVNVGTSTTIIDINMEIEKCKIAIKYDTDSIMDLSVSGDLSNIRRVLIKNSELLPFGTVPTYQAYLDSVRKFKSLPNDDYFIKVIEEHLKDCVYFMTIHASINEAKYI
ncbi:MAG: phosphomethylpyrimidine synthase ThiC [Candidatus Methanomethylicia archaeon]|nr:phosphomethylpyrimidine synthase ThiC [Candidatus Methanomethylicia archaeon]